MWGRYTLPVALQVTEVKVYPVDGNDQLKAFVRITICDCFVVRDLKVIENTDGHLFVAMPTRRDRQGVFHDVAHPIDRGTREALEDLVLAAYRQEMNVA